MANPESYPFHHHPCFSESRQNLWARIHLPTALRCNVKCIFCDHNSGSSCHTSKPGYARRIMTPDEAINRAEVEMKKNSQLRIVAISGPGEPLANEETFTTLKGIRDKHKSVKFCLSTNGVKLEEKATILHELGVESVSVSISALRPGIVSKIYEWAIIDDQLLKGLKMGESIIQRQLRGIEKVVELGMTVKVNTILIPEINMQEMNQLSQRLASKGASLQNIVPLIANPSIPHLNPPTKQELAEARRIGSQYLPQFTHCKQCRSDVVGIPGDDIIL